jgi:hypothetical protein
MRPALAFLSQKGMNMHHHIIRYVLLAIVVVVGIVFALMRSKKAA